MFQPFTIPAPPSLDEDGQEVVTDTVEEVETESRSNSAGKTSALEQGTQIPAGWKPTAAEPVPVIRCTYIKPDGNQCGRWSIRGGKNCIKHGGRLPNVVDHANAVVESARMRLFGLADEAVDVLEDVIQNSSQEQMRLKAAEMVLNRAGIKDAIDINVEVKQTTNLAEDVLKKLEIMRERRLAAEAEEAAAQEELVDEGEILDEDTDTV